MTTSGPSQPEVGRRQWIGLVVLAVGLSMIVIDGTIVGVALPTIITDLSLDLTDAQWVNSLYSVVFAALLLSTGRLGDRTGRRRVFMIGLVIFMAGSVMAAVSDSSTSLIWARVVQGIGGACILPGTLSTVNATFRGRSRAVAFGIWGAVISGAAALGPLLGGWLTTSFTWQWIFWINIPIGLAVLVGAALVVPETRSAEHARGVDVDGLLLSAIGLGALVFAVIEGSTLGWWRPLEDFTVLGLTWPATWPISIIPVLFAVAAASLWVFVLWERHRARVQRSAILDLTLFRIETFSWGNITAATIAVGEFAIVFVLPLFLVNALGLSEMGAGLILAAMALGAFVSGASARHLAARYGPPKVVLIGLTLEIVGVCAVILVVSATVSGWWIAALLVIYGAGLGLASAQLTSTVLHDVPVNASGQGSATQSTVRQVGAAVGAAVAGAALAVGLGRALPAALEGVPGLTAQQATELAAATQSSAGATITALREGGPAGALADPEAVVAALSQGFADGTRWALVAAVVFVALGLLSAFRVLVVSRREAQRAPDVVA